MLVMYVTNFCVSLCIVNRTNILDFSYFNPYTVQSGREISVIIVTDDYLCYREPKSPYNFLLTLIYNELFKFKTSDEW